MWQGGSGASLSGWSGQAGWVRSAPTPPFTTGQEEEVDMEVMEVMEVMEQQRKGRIHRGLLENALLNWKDTKLI